MGSPYEAATKTNANLFIGGSSSAHVGGITLTSSSSFPPGGTAPSTVVGPAQEVDENQIFDVGSATVAFTLTVLMSVGIGLNSILLLIVTLHPRVRQLVNAFIGHYAVISVLKCVFCIVFATSLTTRFETSLCDKIGGSYVVLTSVEVFNLLAMVCAEAYFFGQANVGRDARGSCCCVLIGLFLIYLGSVILHLGPTIIAGGIGFNRTAGSCIFGFKSIQSYVAHAIWVVITTLGIISVLYYLSVVYREVQSCQPHRVSSLVRASVPETTTRTQQHVDHLKIRRIVADSQRRAVVLILVTCTFVITSYPLFLLTLFDIGFSVEGSIYRIFTFFSWINTLINPLLFLLVDRKFGLIRLLKPCNRFAIDEDMLNHHPTYYDPAQTSANAPSGSGLVPPLPKPMQHSVSVGGAGSPGGVVNERTGLISKSTERLHYDIREEDDVNLGCGGGLGANRGSLKHRNVDDPGQQPAILHQWQSRVGGRLYLQGELTDANNNDDSVLMGGGDNNPGTVIVYDRLNAASQSVFADQQQQQMQARPNTTGRFVNCDFPASPTRGSRTVQLMPCLSAGSLLGQSSTPTAGRHQAYWIHGGSSNTNVQQPGQSNFSYSNASVQQRPPMFNGGSNDYIGPSMGSSPQQLPIYRPQSVVSTIDTIGKQQSTPSTMTMLARQRQLQQQQLQQQRQSVKLPTLRIVANAANNISNNISFRNCIGAGNKTTISSIFTRPQLAATTSFIGTEDSLEDVIYSNSSSMFKNNNEPSNSNNIVITNNGDDGMMDDEETTC